jgi:small subunit ribosomal protein S1
MKIEADKEGRPKISLSIKSLEPDAWEKGLGFEEGEIIRGKVSRLTDFGAFVEVAPGADGLSIFLDKASVFPSHKPP